MDFNTFTIERRPELREAADCLSSAAWPEFLLHDATTARYWDTLYESFAAFQLLICEGGEVIALGNTIPVYWNGFLEGLPEGLDSVLERGVDARERWPTALAALAAVVSAEHRGRNLGTMVLRAMKALAVKHGLRDLIAPVRPSLKHAYPLVTMEEYISWKREDGTRFDPWMRTHDKLGAEVLRVAPHSMSVSGTIEQWESWTGMDLSTNGEHLVSGALCPVIVDHERDIAIYREPNVWMHHPAA